MERYIAIDNVCAWPNVTNMPDQSIVAMIFNQPVHGRWEGDVECWGSEDDGYTWHKRGVPAQHEPGTNRMSEDRGETWSNPTILVDLEDHPPRADGIDCGYPSSAQTDDGTIVTAYYCSWVEQHNRYHMGVIRWQPDELNFVYSKKPTDDRA